MLGFVPIGGLSQNRALIDVIGDLGLTANLQLCIDVGDSRCYAGSGQGMLDQSGNAHDMYLGTDATGANDPTFTGTAGRQSAGEYLLGNGLTGLSQSVTSLQAGGPTWIQQFHQDSALFTILQWVYLDGIVSKVVAAGTFITGTTSEAGIQLTNSANGSLKVQFKAFKSGGANNLVGPVSTVSMTDNAWNLLGVSMDEAAGNLNYVSNSTVELHTSQTYPTADVSTASRLRWLADSTATVGSINRGAQLAIWSRALTSTQIGAIYTAMRQRYGV